MGSSLTRSIEAYVAKVEKPDPRLAQRLADFKQGELRSKESGFMPPWEGYRKAKDRAYYQKLSTADLARECFSTSLWARDTLIYDEPAYGIVRAEVFHAGFSVLFERPDFWEGIAIVYRYLAEELTEAKDEMRQMDLLFNLKTLKYAYTFPSFQERLQGREMLLLQANLDALRMVLSYRNGPTRIPGRTDWSRGVDDALCWPMIALLKRAKPDKYSELLRKLERPELSPAKPDGAQPDFIVRLVMSAVEEALRDIGGQIGGGNALVEAAHKTYAAHRRGLQAGNEKGSAEIPARYWAQEIKALKPLRVYYHQYNLVVVQRVLDDVEEGTYVFNPISSYLPMSGDDGFIFSPNPMRGNTYHLGTGVFHFKRTKGK